MVLRAPPSQEQLASLEARIGYSFRDRSLLQLALFHPSFGFMNNMNLAWLGDKVLDLIESARSGGRGWRSSCSTVTVAAERV